MSKEYNDYTHIDYKHGKSLPLGLANVLEKVISERENQDKKWGQQNHDLPYWLMILGEEVGEANKAVLEKDYINYKDELIQVAAVAVAAVESFYRNHSPNE